ncbi:hypothetical protein [Haloarcula sp. JP-L23]|uniref:hypothetical protein n=1 Tax=Haloarcula sp. JP-L23 TaxID=2716717 RepID=UPI00140F3AA7|nr:hypothetical protein G9465_23765 [Haloarcula sp. JP-L23]
MADTAKPPEDRCSRIVAKIGIGEHDVLTTSEIAVDFEDEFEDEHKGIRRNLHWMREQGLISGRRTTKNENGSTWLWWVAVDDGAAEELSAGAGVATASQAGTLLRDLFHGRREFQLVAVGVFIIPLLFGVALWGMVLSKLGVIETTPIEVLALVGGGFLLSLLLVVAGLFIFPVETLGNWPDAVDADRDDEQPE